MTTEITSKVERSPTPASGDGPRPPAETEEEKAKRLLYCSLCRVAVNSASQLEAHNSGTKHKTMLEARNGSGTIKAFPRVGVKGKGPVNRGNTGLQNKTFHCEICDVHVNSETQLKQHISSRRHKDRAAGKPPKPKYSPYNKLQKAAHPLGVSVAFASRITGFLSRAGSSPLAEVRHTFSWAQVYTEDGDGRKPKVSCVSRSGGNTAELGNQRGHGGAVGSEGTRELRDPRGHGSCGIRGDTGAAGSEGTRRSCGIRGDTGAAGSEGTRRSCGIGGDTAELRDPIAQAADLHSVLSPPVW
nr:zinc finger protein 385D-like [Odocoileus virginianus texanus]